MSKFVVVAVGGLAFDVVFYFLEFLSSENQYVFMRLLAL
jgi:hypothetical protein